MMLDHWAEWTRDGFKVKITTTKIIDWRKASG